MSTENNDHYGFLVPKSTPGYSVPNTNQAIKNLLGVTARVTDSGTHYYSETDGDVLPPADGVLRHDPSEDFSRRYTSQTITRYHSDKINEINNQAQAVWAALTNEKAETNPTTGFVAFFNEKGDLINPEGFEEAYAFKDDDRTKLILNRSDFLIGIDKDDMVPALVLADRSADNLLTKVIEAAVENLQHLTSTGVKQGTDYTPFTQPPTTEDEEPVELVMSEGAKFAIDRMIDIAEGLLTDTANLQTLEEADIASVQVCKNRVEITLVK